MKYTVSLCGCLLLSCTILYAQPQFSVSTEKTECAVRLNVAVLQDGGIRHETVIRPELNSSGHFSRIGSVQPHQKVPVQIAYPDGHAGDRIAVVAADGGVFDNDQSVLLARLDNRKMPDFRFRVAAEPGLYRVFLRKGNDVKVLQFWVGKDPVMKQ